MNSLNAMDTQSLESKKSELFTNIQYDIENFRNNILHISENVGEKLFENIFDVEVNTLASRVKQKIDRFENQQLVSFTDENLTPPENG